MFSIEIDTLESLLVNELEMRFVFFFSCQLNALLCCLILAMCHRVLDMFLYICGWSIVLRNTAIISTEGGLQVVFYQVLSL